MILKDNDWYKQPSCHINGLIPGLKTTKNYQLKARLGTILDKHGHEAKKYIEYPC